MKGEPSSATATSSSDCQTTGDDGGFHQDQRDGGGGDGNSAEIDGDDHESGRHATGLRSDMEHTGSEKTESEMMMTRVYMPTAMLSLHVQK